MRLPGLFAISFGLAFTCSFAAEQEPFTYYQAIQRVAPAPIPEAEFREIELTGYYLFQDKESYRALFEAYSSTSEPAWSVIYAEVYCNLDHESEACARLSRRAVELLRAAVKEDGNRTTIALTHQHDMAASEGEGQRWPMSMSYEMSFALATAVSGVGSFAPITLEKLNRIRTTQLHVWHEKGLMQNDLIKRLFEVEAAGHFEAYDYWLLRPAFPDEFDAWRSAHANQYADWEEWLRGDPYSVRSNDFQRLHGLVAPAGAGNWSPEDQVAATLLSDACMFRPDQHGRVQPLLRRPDRIVQPGRRWGVEARF